MKKTILTVGLSLSVLLSSLALYRTFKEEPITPENDFTESDFLAPGDLGVVKRILSAHPKSGELAVLKRQLFLNGELVRELTEYQRVREDSEVVKTFLLIDKDQFKIPTEPDRKKNQFEQRAIPPRSYTMRCEGDQWEFDYLYFDSSHFRTSLQGSRGEVYFKDTFGKATDQNTLNYTCELTCMPYLEAKRSFYEDRPKQGHDGEPSFTFPEYGHSQAWQAQDTIYGPATIKYSNLMDSLEEKAESYITHTTESPKS
ncbi:hypothetical protein [Rubritalea sp.]|uniref:hypothetical protein n=1 Tax=Rubritalea sp. TaxID=2109375 RepID=UPI003EF2D513